MKVTVIGAGIIGVSTAYYLQRAGHTVSVIERESGPALETSFANGGIITPSFCEPWNAPGVFLKILKSLGKIDSAMLLRIKALPSLTNWGLKFLWQSRLSHFVPHLEYNTHLANYTLKLMAQLNQELALDFDFKQTGTLVIFRDEASFAAGLKLADLKKEAGVSFESLDKKSTILKEPTLTPIQSQIVGSLYFPDDASGDAYLFTTHLAKTLQEQGVLFRYNTNVAFSKVTEDVVSIKIKEETFVPDAIVLAGGPMSPQLARTLDINLPIKPCKGYSLTIPKEEWENFPQMPILDDTYHVVITPLGEKIRVAGTAEFAGFDKDITPERIKNLFTVLKKLYPQELARIKRENIKYWAGLRPVCIDDVPIISETQYKNLFINTGHGHIGWTTGLGSGKLMADIITKEQPQIEKDYFSIKRF